MHQPPWSSQSPQKVPAKRFYTQLRDSVSLLTSWRVTTAYEMMRRGQIPLLDDLAEHDWDNYYNESHHWDRTTLSSSVNKVAPILTAETGLLELDDSVLRMLDRIEKTWMADHLRTLYSVVVCQAWAAFEVYVTDLWEVGILQSREFLVTFLTKQRSPLVSLARDQNIPLLNLVQVVRGDASIVQFQRFPQIYESYSRTFGKDERLRSLLHFESNRALYELAQLRHLIMHCGGIVDQEYLDKIGRRPSLVVGENVVLTKAVVCDLLTKCVETALSLGEWVWLKYERDWHPAASP